LLDRSGGNIRSELSIVKLFLQYNKWSEYSKHLSASDFPEDLQLLYRTLGAFHQTNEGKVDLSVWDLANLFFSNRPRDVEYFESVFKHLDTYQDPIEETVVSLISSIRKARLLRELSIRSYEVAEGKKPYDDVDKLLKELQESIGKIDEQIGESDEFVTDDLQVLLDRTFAQPGLKFRLKILNKALGSLRKGNFGFIFARPESGKTTFLASEVSFMLDQTDKPIIWFNNEEAGSIVMLRVYQAYFGVTLEQLYSNIGKYRDLFQQQTEGRFKLYDFAAINKTTVDRLAEKLQPALIVFDQIDKIQGFKADREDLLLGSIYQWGRELAKRYCPVIGVTQADGSGEGLRWLTMSNVANAKTAKQAEADFIIGIGAIQDTGWESIRFLNISKNKLLGDRDTDPKLRHGKLEVFIEPQIGRYRDL